MIDGTLKAEYKAETTKPTLVNLSNHVYFNLSGDCQNDVLDHKVTIKASKMTPRDSDFLPTGQVQSVQDSIYDFRLPVKIGDVIRENGFCVNYILDDDDISVVVSHEESGRESGDSDGSTVHGVLHREFLSGCRTFLERKEAV